MWIKEAEESSKTFKIFEICSPPAGILELNGVFFLKRWLEDSQ